jgi:hypothetical protein
LNPIQTKFNLNGQVNGNNGSSDGWVGKKMVKHWPLMNSGGKHEEATTQRLAASNKLERAERQTKKESDRHLLRNRRPTHTNTHTHTPLCVCIRPCTASGPLFDLIYGPNSSLMLAHQVKVRFARAATYCHFPIRLDDVDVCLRI